MYQLRSKVLDQAFLAHVMNDLFGSVIRTLVLVIFQQVLKNVTQHFGVNGHRVIVGTVFVDGEVVLVEKVEQVFKQARGEVSVHLSDHHLQIIHR